jgi:hypothetical protein
MEFSFTITEQDYVKGTRAAMKRNRATTWKTILFSLFITICLVLLVGVVRKNSRVSEIDADRVESQPAQTQSFGDIRALTIQVAPFAGLVGPFLFLFLFWVPYQMRVRYRKDTNVHGVFTVVLDTDSFALETSIGSSARSKWSAFKEWHETGDLVLLRYPSSQSQLLVLRGLSEPQREELRGILTAALPKKR